MTTRATTPSPAAVAFPALGTTAAVLVTDPHALPTAESILRAELATIDITCSRFRPDSELNYVNLHAGVPTKVSERFAEALLVALRAAEVSDGAVDPTVGCAVTALGYDRTFASLRPDDSRPLPVARPAPGWHKVAFDPRSRRLLLPAHARLDFGATAKALTADRAALHTAVTTGCGVLVSLGGDLRVAGAAPEGGWRIGLADDHTLPTSAPGPAVTMTGGALATSGIGVRTWRRGGRIVHHIVDPATGEPATPVWRTVTVAAATCEGANTASTGAIVKGDRAVDWLHQLGLPARLVDLDGRVVQLGGWPPDSPASPCEGPR
ncbi:FAD:protein FMN transferase [Streptomyces sp. NPDC051776]|uniref:FAD:protein FMN transferase n=1 Tax=Streptomyces sp. NPDC051776 TaxID=3155414 RepID=UPI0034380958